MREGFNWILPTMGHTLFIYEQCMAEHISITASRRWHLFASNHCQNQQFLAHSLPIVPPLPILFFWKSMSLRNQECQTNTDKGHLSGLCAGCSPFVFTLSPLVRFNQRLSKRIAIFRKEKLIEHENRSWKLWGVSYSRGHWGMSALAIFLQSLRGLLTVGTN